MDPRLEELKALLPRCMLYDWVRLGSRVARVLRDPRLADQHASLVDRLLERARASVALREWRATHRPAVSYPPELPITGRREEIVAALRARQVVVISGETGSGKTTQIPKMCLEAGFGVEGRIGCTQPRRVAALSISRRLAEELNVQWGAEVGSKIRFDDHSSPQTFIKLMTDGMLLAEAQGDPLLSEYNALVLDEAHERSLNIDFLLGHLKGLLERRQDLKLVITSATLDTAAFSAAFGDAPVIEVSGRLYPVEVRYEPVDAESEERGDLTYVDAAVRAVERVVDSGSGDVLVFMPGERDIRECSDQLEGRLGGRAEVVPLYGRLSSGDQQRVFTPSSRRRIIIATNIAETSLTIPGIRFVVDTGLARLSRYNPRTRTRRLPIEPISQGSANQRKGRAGRVQDGICIRLYSEDDFEGRPPFTQPEIQRANLAEVILRMKAFHLGDIETFPFLNPPTPAAIRTGYQLLHELGALDEQRALTPLGRDLARLPIDPTLGRMLLQAQQEHAVRELLIIASGLSIQDPRERPADQQAAAEAAHRRMADPRSDFLTLLKIWDAVHDQWEALRTQNQRRRYCRENFLSYLRMREWQDLHAQLHDALQDLGTVRLNESNASYDAVHRAILSGLLAHAARREERNVYQATGKRRVMVFPGSSLFERGERPPRRGGERQEALRENPERRTAQPAWLVAGEIVETTQVYARTVAGIQPEWIAELAPHLCEVRHQNPHWSARAGRVLAEEITTFSGLELRRRKVAFGNIDAAQATALFIRGALVEEQLLPGADDAEEVDLPLQHGRRGVDAREKWRATAAQATRLTQDRPLPPMYRFLEHNRRIREKVETWQTRVRRADLMDLDGALERFYARHLSGLSSRDELNRWLREPGRVEALCAREEEITGGADLSFNEAAFPDQVTLEGQPVALRYAYAPGEEHDGVTVQVPFGLARVVTEGALEWAVPGLREAKAEELLRALPKSLRAQLLPIAPKAREIAQEFEPRSGAFHADLARFIHSRYGISVPAGTWNQQTVPNHLRPRLEVVGPDGRALASGRDVAALKQQIAEAPAPQRKDTGAWARAAAQWEKAAVTGWTFGDLPPRITVSEADGLAVFGWPGLALEGDIVHVRLHRTEAEAQAGTRAGLPRLVELALQKEMAWVRKDLRALSKFAPWYAPLGTSDELEESAYHQVCRQVLPSGGLNALTRTAFEAAVAAARERIPGVVPRLITVAGEILQLRQQVAAKLGVGATTAAPPAAARVVKDLSQLGSLVVAKPPPKAVAATTAPEGSMELGELVPARFLSVIPPERLPHLPRYLKALLLRWERRTANPPRDRDRQQLLVPYLNALRELRASGGSPERRAAVEEFRWLVEEYRVSLFAQELGTSVPVSPKRLDERLVALRGIL